jgi:flagellar P-ring protein FlgI
MRTTGAITLICLALFAVDAQGSRLKDLANLEGARENQLVGYGLVVGLAGTGDRRQTVFSAQSLTNMLQKLGVEVNPNAIRVTNTAAVIVTAMLPPFSESGMKIDVTASAIGDASSLSGGTLVACTLKGADGQVYAVAQGSVVTGGYTAGGAGTNKTLNHPTVGRVPTGAIVERQAPTPTPADTLRWQLNQPDFTTASRIVDKVNAEFGKQGQPIAFAEGGGAVTVKVPPSFKNSAVRFIAELERLPIEADRPARVVVSERTGTIVVGGDVTIGPVSVMHGALSVQVQTTLDVSQPPPLSKTGTTEVVPQVDVAVQEEKAKSLSLPKGATVEQLVKGLLAIGATARDVISVLQNIKAAGAMDAELEVI